jgi:hypothetical protein
MKHLLRLYPRSWRDRYGAEIGALVERQRLSVKGLLDLLKGAADAHLHPALAAQRVFIPTIGFRPGGTRTLLERAETSADDTHLTILAVAATPERTELMVEWERVSEPAVCVSPAVSEATPSIEMGAPPKRPPSIAPPESQLSATLSVGSRVLESTSVMRHSVSYSSAGSWSVRSMDFPALPPGARRAALQVSDGERHWIVPFRLVPARLTATPVTAQSTKDDITVKVTDLAHHDDQLVVGMEVSAGQTVRRIGEPAPAIPILPSGRKFKVARGAGFAPIVLEDDRGVRREEIRRIFPLRDQPDAHVDGERFVQRFSVLFDEPSPEARSIILIVPFVELTDQRPSAVADLRQLPVDLVLGEHRMRLLSADAYPGSDHRHMKLAVEESTTPPRFIQPAAVQGAPGGSYSWGGSPERGEPFWMEAAVGDPPLVTFRGAVLRYDGPWRLEFPLSPPN